MVTQKRASEAGWLTLRAEVCIAVASVVVLFVWVRSGGALDAERTLGVAVVRAYRDAESSKIG